MFQITIISFLSGKRVSIIETTHGKVQGQQEEELCVFRGIPYAEPPLGRNRWTAPMDHKPWSGVRKAFYAKPVSWQNQQFDTAELAFAEDPEPPSRSEDCLTLNIWTPGLDEKKRAVMFWIHGGGFTGGSGSSPIYDGRSLAKKGDVVVVSINYRLGCLGFLNLNEVTGGRIPATGNEGLLDQVMALRWVNDNIAQFGGDPENVTIFGESAGGMSVGGLMAMPAARGLFKRAIPQSGACHTAYPLSKSTEVAEAFLRILGVSANSELDRLYTFNPDHLLSAANALQARMAGMIFQPCIDGSVLPDIPIQCVSDGSADGVDVLVGATRDEWRLFASMDPGSAEMSRDDLRKRISKSMNGVDAEDVIRVYEEMLTSIDKPSTPHDVHSAIESDRAFRIPAIRLSEVLHERGQSNYQYLFTVESPGQKGKLGACHAIDIGYVFGTHAMNRMTTAFFGFGESAARLGDVTQDAWIAFAKTGDPSTSALASWQPYDTETRSTALLGCPESVESDPYGSTRAIWDQEELKDRIGTL